MDHAGLVLMRHLAIRRYAAEHTSEILHAHWSVGEQRDLGSRKLREIGWHAGEGFLAAGFECARGGIAAILRHKEAVEKQSLIGDTHFRQFRSCSIRFGE